MLCRGVIYLRGFTIILTELVGTSYGAPMKKKRKIHLVGWTKVTKPKDQGGLGLHAAKERNLTLASKLCWRMKNEGEKPWAKVLRHKYCKKADSSKAPKSRT